MMTERNLVSLTVRNPFPVDRRDDFVVCGVPLRQGEVQDPALLSLTGGAGRKIACQADLLARWADGSAKWVLLTIPGVSIKAGGRLRFRLRTARKAPTPQGIRLRRTRSGLRVDSGRIRFTIPEQGPIVSRLESLCDGNWRRRGGDLDLRMAVDRGSNSQRYRASAAERVIEVEVEGPLRSVIRVSGVHRSADGRRSFGPYTMRLEVLAGRPELRITHSFIYDGDPDRDFVRASEIVLTASVGASEHAAAFGADEGTEARFQRQRADFCPDFRYAELYQDSASHWRVGRWVERQRREVFGAEGLRSDGWMEFSGGAGRVAVAVRDFWQNHPKGLGLDAETGEICVSLYPQRAEPLNLTRYSAHVYPWTYEAPSFRGKKVVPTDPSHGAHGIRKTHDCAIFLDEPNPSAKAFCLNHPLLLEWTSSHTTRTGIVTPAARRTDQDWLLRLNGFADFLGEEMIRSGGTGYLDYFDLPHGFNVEEGRWYHDFGGWGYDNDEAMACLGLWHTYLLTHRHDVFAMARAMARHNGDIDSYLIGERAGYGSRHNVNHWGDNCKDRRVSQPIGKRFLYYLTGDRSVLDLAHVVLESFRRQAAKPHRHNMTCDVPSLVATLLLLEESGLEAGETWLRALADAVAASVDESGAMRAFLTLDAQRQQAEPVPEAPVICFMMFSCFGGAQAFAELAERYDHGALREALVRFARYQMLPQKERQERELGNQLLPADMLNTFRALDLLGYAYSVTGDPAFRERAADHARTVCVDLQSRPEPVYGVPAATSRTVPVLVDWPDTPTDNRRRWKEWYPLFPRHSSGQFFNMAVYMHKIQGLMLLLTGK